MAVNRKSYFSNEAPGAVASRNARSPFGDLAVETKDAPKRYKVWLNAGIAFEDEFITPFGIALDLFEPAEIRSQSPETVRRMKAQNAIIVNLKKIAESMEQGETRFINLQLQMRRVHEESVELAPADEYAIDMDSLLFAKAAE
jgi:hypothetical protein